MLSVESITIRDVRYKVRMMPAGLGLQVLARMLNVIGPGVKNLRDEDATGDTLAKAFGALISDPALSSQLDYFCDKFKQYSTVEIGGKEQELENTGVFDVHFAGNYYDLLQWLTFCFKVNHGSFLAEVGQGFQTALADLVTRLQSQSPKAQEKNG